MKGIFLIVVIMVVLAILWKKFGKSKIGTAVAESFGFSNEE